MYFCNIIKIGKIMKKQIVTLFVALAAFIANAQSVKIIYNGAELNNNDTVFVPASSQGDEVNTYFGYRNATGSLIEFKVRKEVIQVADPDAVISFCINGQCYTGNQSQTIELNENQMVSADDEQQALHTTFESNAAPALVKFTIFLVDDESDQASFFISFGTSSAVRGTDIVKTLNAYPNPASNMVNIDYVAPAANACLVIKNLTGREVYRTAISQNGRSRVDLSEFSAGMYLYGLEVDGKMVCTKKLLVK